MLDYKALLKWLIALRAYGLILTSTQGHPIISVVLFILYFWGFIWYHKEMKKSWVIVATASLLDILAYIFVTAQVPPFGLDAYVVFSTIHPLLMFLLSLKAYTSWGKPAIVVKESFYKSGFFLQLPFTLVVSLVLFMILPSFIQSMFAEEETSVVQSCEAFTEIPLRNIDSYLYERNQSTPEYMLLSDNIRQTVFRSCIYSEQLLKNEISQPDFCSAVRASLAVEVQQWSLIKGYLGRINASAEAIKNTTDIITGINLLLKHAEEGNCDTSYPPPSPTE